jgi:hypothetical protein
MIQLSQQYGSSIASYVLVVHNIRQRRIATAAAVAVPIAILVVPTRTSIPFQQCPSSDTNHQVVGFDTKT